MEPLPATLTKSERTVLALLRKTRGTVSHAAMMAKLYGGSESSPDPRVLKQFIFTMKRKLDISVRSVVGEGYELSPATRAQLDQRFGPHAAVNLPPAAAGSAAPAQAPQSKAAGAAP